MISIDENYNIKISRGDTFTIRINLIGSLTLGENDFVRFAVKRTIGSSEVLFSKDVKNPGASYVDVFFDLDELAELTNDSYRYDVTLMSRDTQKIYTLIWDAQLSIRGVAHHAEF